MNLTPPTMINRCAPSPSAKAPTTGLHLENLSGEVYFQEHLRIGEKQKLAVEEGVAEKKNPPEPMKDCS